MVYDHRFGEGILVLLDNQAFGRLSEQDRAAYLKKTIAAVRGGTPVITPPTRSLPAPEARTLLSDS